MGRKTKRISSVILKMDENNQYGQAMRKPLLCGCIKRNEKPPTFMEFIHILDRIFHKDKIENLFIVDIKFHYKNPKTLLFNEIYRPVFEKHKKMDRYKRFCLQLLSVIKRNEEKETSKVFPTPLKLIQLWKKKSLFIFTRNISIFWLKEPTG